MHLGQTEGLPKTVPQTVLTLSFVYSLNGIPSQGKVKLKVKLCIHLFSCFVLQFRQVVFDAEFSWWKKSCNMDQKRLSYCESCNAHVTADGGDCSIDVWHTFPNVFEALNYI